MRDHLDGFSQVSALTLFFQDGLVDLTGCPVMCLGSTGGCEPFVVTQVEVGFGSVIGDIDFPVLEGTHGPRIDIQVGIEFLDRDLVAVAFEKPPD